MMAAADRGRHGERYGVGWRIHVVIEAASERAARRGLSPSEAENVLP